MNRDDDQAFDLETQAEPVERRTPVARTSGKRRRTQPPTEDATPAGEAASLPWPLRPGWLLVLGALLLAVAWLGRQNPYANINLMPYWPWDLFRANLDQGGEVVFLWDRFRAFALGGAVLIVALLVVAVFRAGRARAAGALAAAGAGLALFWRDLSLVFAEGNIRSWAIPVAAALLAGAVVGRDGRTAARGPNGLILALVLVLAGVLFFPLPGLDTYDADAFAIATPFQQLASGELGAGLDRLWSGDGLHVVGLVLLLILGLLTLFGLRGPWTTPVAVGLLLATALAPLLGHAVLGFEAPDNQEADLLRSLGGLGWTALAASAVILLAGLVSALGLGGRWTMGVAGTALGILVLVVTSRYALVGLETSQVKLPFFAAALRAEVWLGPLMGAFFAPLAAALVDVQGPK